MSINPRTLQRRKREGRLTFEESDRLYRLGELYRRSRTALGSGDAARDWLTRPAKAYGGLTPLVYAGTEVGYQDLLEVIEGIQYTDFS